MRRVRDHLTYANVASTIALMIAVAGGTAYAANTIGSEDVIDDSLLSQDIKNDAIGSVDLKNKAAVQSPDVRNHSLTGQDIQSHSGVDTCTGGTPRFPDSELCVFVWNEQHTWADAADRCAGLTLRLPSLGEAQLLAGRYDLPNVDPNETFWTEERLSPGSAFVVAQTPADRSVASTTENHETVCVTTPSN